MRVKRILQNPFQIRLEMGGVDKSTYNFSNMSKTSERCYDSITA